MVFFSCTVFIWFWYEDRAGLKMNWEMFPFFLFSGRNYIELGLFSL